MSSGRPTLKQLVTSNVAWHKKYERGLMQRNLAYYQQRWHNLFGEELDQWHRENYTFNIIHMMVTSAIAEIVGNNPRAYARAVRPSSKLFEHDATVVMEHVFAVSMMRSTLALAITDAALKRRGALKRRVDPATRMPFIHKVNPERLFFDKGVQVARDSAYWLEATLVPWARFMDRVKSGKYHSPNLSRVASSGYVVPKWMREAVGAQVEDFNGVRYIVVWEFYDAYAGTVIHYHLESDSVLFKGDVSGHPYSMFSLIPNGQNMVGISEAELIMPQQYLVNSQMNLWHDTCDASVSGLIADAGLIDGSSAEKVAAAGPGELTMVNRTAEGRRNRRMTLRDAIIEKPVPQHPEQNKQLLDVVVQHAQQMTGYTPGHRGQFENVRTAREVAFVEARVRNLISHKIGEVQDAVADQATKCWDLIVQYAPNGLNVRSRGPDGGYAALGDWLEQAAGMQFEMVSYNPIRHDPAVQAETILVNKDWFRSSPNYDQRVIDEVVHRGLALPDAALRDHAEVVREAEEKAQAQAAAQTGAGGAPGPGGLPPGLPPGLLPMG